MLILPKWDPSKDGKENNLVLTDACTKFSQAFVTPNQKTVTIAKILVDKWFDVYGIPACMHSDKGWSFDNELMTHLFAMYAIEQSTTTPYILCGNATCEKVEPYINWPAEVTTKGAEEQLATTSTIYTVYTYNAMWHRTTSYKPYELIFGCKAPTTCDAWLRLTNYNDNFSQSKCAWANQQQEIILAANRWALKRIKHSVEKSVSQPGGKALDIPLGNLVLLHDHPEGHQIQDSYKVNCFSWNWSTVTQMCIPSNHLLVRVLCIW